MIDFEEELKKMGNDFLVLCHTDQVELFGGDGHREVLLGRLCELDPDGAVRQAVRLLVLCPHGKAGRAFLPAAAHPAFGRALQAAGQIGRASCRERV